MPLPLVLPLPSSRASLLNRWASAPPHNYSVPTDFGNDQKPVVLFDRSPKLEKVAHDVSSRFGRRLRELRRSHELTQTEMARKFGIDRSFISDVERGRKSISLPMLEVIALGLKVSLSELLDNL